MLVGALVQTVKFWSVITGSGLTFTITVKSEPKQPPSIEVGVTVYSIKPGELLILLAFPVIIPVPECPIVSLVTLEDRSVTIQANELETELII